MKTIIINLIIIMQILLSCSGNSLKGKSQTNLKENVLKNEQDKKNPCYQILTQFFIDYEKILIQHKSKLTSELFDENFKRNQGNHNKKSILEFIEKNKVWITEYKVTVNHCSMPDNNTILWEGSAWYGNGFTQYPNGSIIKKKQEKWRQYLIND